MKKRIFIGSASEQLHIVEKIKDALSEKFEVVIWNEEFFDSGEYVYPTLTKKLITFDYAIMIAGNSDITVRIAKKTEHINARDNVYIEYGLCSGMLAPRRVMLLKHKDCIIASDLAGMLVDEYESDDEAVKKALSWVAKNVQREATNNSFNRNEIDLLPTTGIAIGYFLNFVTSVVAVMRKCKEVTYKGVNYPINLQKAKIHILVPYNVKGDIRTYIQNRKEDLSLDDAMIGGFRVIIDPLKLKEEALIVYDIPSTLLAIFKTIEYIFDLHDGDQSTDSIFARQRALNNFADIIKNKVDGDDSVSNYVIVERC